MNCGIVAHSGRSPNNGSTEKDLCKQPHGDHRQDIDNTCQKAKPGWGEWATMELVSPNGVDHVGTAPLAIPW
jgi:hypothetical protein